MQTSDKDQTAPDALESCCIKGSGFDSQTGGFKVLIAEIERLRAGWAEAFQLAIQHQERAEAAEARADTKPKDLELEVAWRQWDKERERADALETKLKEQEAEIERLQALLEEWKNNAWKAHRDHKAAEARADRAHDDAIERAAVEAAIFGDEGIARHIRALKKGSGNG